MTCVRIAIALVALVSATFAVHVEGEAPQGRLITSLAVAINPATHKVYAVNEGAGTVVVTDETSGSTRSVKVGAAPIALAINRTTNRIYVLNTESGTISVIDGRSDEVVATIKVEATPYVLAVDETSDKIYVTYTYSSVVTVIDDAANTRRSFKVGSADGIALDSPDHAMFLTTYEDPNIRIVDVTNGTTSKVLVGPHIWGLVFDASSHTLYLAHTGTADIVALNEKTHDVYAIPVGEIPCAVAINPSTHTLYAVNYGSETVSVIDTGKRKVIATLHVGEHPQAVAVDVTRNRIYVANVHGNSVTVIDGVKNTVIGTHDAGINPYALAVDATTGYVYAANYGEPPATAINGPDIAKQK
ncbi:YncE family protein [Acidobacterium sp. S8]|uniref:YncE family protein n=1 Tax=Acidobacterium sp. S8 TaxID=1641854 RepID=UPI00131DC5B2|nr:YncE family protein [Acidobacterium sp. S8]